MTRYTNAHLSLAYHDGEHARGMTELGGNRSHGQLTILLCEIWYLSSITSDADFQESVSC